jgi:hypothetical protein
VSVVRNERRSNALDVLKDNIVSRLPQVICRVPSNNLGTTQTLLIAVGVTVSRANEPFHTLKHAFNKN